MASPRELVDRRLAQIARGHGVTLAEMEGRAKLRPVALARAEAMCWLWRRQRWSLRRVGGRFNRSDVSVRRAVINWERDMAKLNYDEAQTLGARLHDWMADQGLTPPMPKTDEEGWGDIVQFVLRHARTVEAERIGSRRLTW